MAITLLAPEYIFGRAVVNLRSCVFHTPQLEDLAFKDGVPWSRYHTCLADMGGFVLTFPRSAGETEGASEHVVDSDEVGNGEGNREESKAPSLPHVAVVPLSPIDLGNGSPGTPGLQSENRLSSPNCRRRDSSFDFPTVDLEAGVIVSPAPHVPFSRASSSSYFSSAADSAIGTASPTPEVIVPSCQDKTAYNGKSVSRAFMSGKDWGESLIRRTRLRYIERKTQRYGPIVWRPHPHLSSLSKTLISSVITTTSGTSTLSEPLALPPGMNKHQLVRALVTLEGDVTPLCAAQLLEARRLGLVSRLPYVTEAMVCDRDKGDTLVKLAAVWQTGWLVLDLIVRQASGLPSSPLEIMVLAFAALALLIYLINWFQPKDVQTPFYIYGARLPTAEELHALAILTPKAHGLWPGVFDNKHIPSVDARKGYYQATRIWGTGMVWSGMVFGSLHLVAWNCAFPSVGEMWAWRGAALVTTAWPSMPGVLGWMVSMLQQWRERAVGPGGDTAMRKKRIRRFWQTVALPILIGPLFCARVFVLVEAYRSLYYLPPESFVTTWTSNVPRFG